MNLSSADDMIQEYCIYRGFVNSFRSIENERAHDKTKSFEAHMIVNQIFEYLHTGGIEHFISLWDFFNKRFFLHLDQEHCEMFAKMKADLIKYYLVACVRSKNKNKLTEFFTNFSREILSGASESNNDLRKWYVLPYLENPDHDKEFMVYFTPKWLDNLKTALFNYITLVLCSAPPPRLLLIDRWFRSESQLELRKSIEENAIKFQGCLEIISTFQIRIFNLHNIIASLVKYVLENPPQESKSSSEKFLLFDDNKLQKCLQECTDLSSTVKAMSKDMRIRDVTDNLLRTSNEKEQVSAYTSSSHKPSRSVTSSFSSTLLLEEVEVKLVELLSEKLRIHERIKEDDSSADES